MENIKKTLVVLMLLASNFNSIAQTCNCQEALNFAVNKTETNYSGFKDKVTSDNKLYYKSYTDSIKLLAAKPENQQQTMCVKLIDAWLKFFNDRHLYTSTGSDKPNNDSIRAQFAGSPTAIFTSASFDEYIMKNKKKLKPLEGIWKYETGQYTIGIYYDKGTYTGFILKADSVYWVPGQIKMQLIPSADSMQVKLYLRDHSIQTSKLNLTGINNGYFEVQQLKWLKLDEHKNLIFKNHYPHQDIVNFRKLDSKTNLLTIKSFVDNYRKLIDSVVSANDKLIQSADNLIIDVRGNGGGSDLCYSSLKKYFFTNPYTIINTDRYCTNDNIQDFKELATNPNYTPKEQEYYSKLAKDMEQHLNQYWSSSQYFNEDTLPILANPKKIAVIIDSYCASTTEQFILDVVSNSKKATIYGEHSMGVLDYANVYHFTVPNTSITVSYPTSRTRRIDMGKGIDNKGIQPQVKLNKTITDWVKYAQKDLEK